MKAGPKAAVDLSVLPFRPRSTGSLRFPSFCEKFIRVPKGQGALSPLRLRSWQRDLVGSVEDADPQPRTAGWMMPRGQGKSTLVAAYGLYRLFLGGEGAVVCVVAVDERQAGIVFNIARRMVELDDELSSGARCSRNGYISRFATRSFIACLLNRNALRVWTTRWPSSMRPASPTATPTRCLTLAQGKREQSTLIAIGTPGPDPNNQVLADLRNYAAEHPDDTSLVWREFSAAGFEDHPVDCQHCWELANPALDDFLHRDAMHALLPPKTREATFRRARLCQFATDTDGAFLPPGVWDGLSTGVGIPDGAEVIVALDGSFSDDTTALLAGTVSTEPHFDTIRVWQRHNGDDTYRVPVAEVEHEIREACRRWRVLEIAADPFRWTRTIQALEAEKLPMVEFPHSPSRLTAATGDLYSAAVNGRLTHSGDRQLAEHVAAAVIVEDARGIRLVEGIPRHGTARKIDLAACLVMAHSRATWRATHKKRKRAYSFK